MVLDYLAIQASSVPCERAFSSSSLTDTKRRNRLGPMMFEALQVLKHWYKKDRIKWMDKWITAEEEMSASTSSNDALAALMAAEEGLVQQALDRAAQIAAFEAGDLT